MKRVRIAVTAAAIGLTVIAPAAQADSNSAEAAIRKVIDEMTIGFNSHDGRAASVMYLTDARLVTVRGEVMSGQAEIEKGLNAIFATRAKNATHKTLDVSIKLLRPDIAVAHVTNELSGLVAPDGQGLPPHQELSLRVFIKHEGEWRVAAFHNTMIRPFTGK